MAGENPDTGQLNEGLALGLAQYPTATFRPTMPLQHPMILELVMNRGVANYVASLHPELRYEAGMQLFGDLIDVNTIYEDEAAELFHYIKTQVAAAGQDLSEGYEGGEELYNRTRGCRNKSREKLDDISTK